MLTKPREDHPCKRRSVWTSRYKERKNGRVESESGSHSAGYNLFIFVQISDGSQGEAEVGNLEEG